MKQRSNKRRQREMEARAPRAALIAEVGQCEMCGGKPVSGSAWPGHRLCVHEIVGGPYRQALLDQRCSTLVLCWLCNGGPAEDASLWPEARQLALLALSRPVDYDLVRHNNLINPLAPRRVTEDEVRVFVEALRHVDFDKGRDGNRSGRFANQGLRKAEAEEQSAEFGDL